MIELEMTDVGKNVRLGAQTEKGKTISAEGEIEALMVFRDPISETNCKSVRLNNTWFSLAADSWTITGIDR